MIDIFYKTYDKDFKWIYYSIESLKKFVTGYKKVVIVMPKKDYDLFDNSILNDLNHEIFLVDEYGNGYLYQQWIKMSAYKYCQSDNILFVDSDCIFDKKINLIDLLKDKIEVLYTDYSKVGDAICWKEPTSKFIGKEVNYEFMRRNFLIFKRDTLIKIHNEYPDLENYIMETDPRFGFSEYNAIGAWIFFNDKENYKFINTDDIKESNSIGRQFWSYSQLNDEDIENIKKILNNEDN